jgi:hypothetical protein
MIDAKEIEAWTSALEASESERLRWAGFWMDATRTLLAEREALVALVRAGREAEDVAVKWATALKFARAQALDMLWEVEWASPGGDGEGFCSACDGSRPYVSDVDGVTVGGHRPDCRLAAILGVK